MKLEYNVFFGNFNSGEIVTYNIFDHGGFFTYCKKAYSEYKDDKEAFSERIRVDLSYCFRYKSEYEVIISHWPPSEKYNDRFKDRKVDIYTQVMLNWDIFIEYLWNNRKLLRR